MVAKRVCLEPGCPVIINTGKSRCAEHERQRDKARGTSSQRGYDYQHQKIRALDKRNVDAGMAHCWRCGARLDPNSPWHEGHDDHDRTIYRGPECVPCNTATAGRR